MTQLVTAPVQPVTPEEEPPARRRRWRWAAILAVVAVLAALVMVSVSADARARAGLRGARSTLAAARGSLVRTAGQLAATRHSLWDATLSRNLVQGSVAATSGRIGSSEQTLSSTQGSSYLAALNVRSLQQCLGGVEQAYTLLGGADLHDAVAALTGSSAACLSLQADQADRAGLVYPFDFPDPFLLRVGSTYYAYATNSAAGNIQIIESGDLSHWTVVGDALPNLPAWSARGDTWAPSVLQVRSSFVMYYTTVDAASGAECISEAVATSPTGPFIDTSTAPLVCQLPLGGSIDPSPFIDAAGHPWLAWKSQGGSQLPALWAQPLSPTATTLAPGGTPARLLTAEQAWEGGIIEGPTMVWWGGHYLLFYSANSWTTANYAIGVAVCASPAGPCIRARPGPLVASQPGMEGPGGPALFTDPAGNPWLAFHAFLPGAVGFPNSRPLFLRRLQLVGGLPVVAPG